MQNEQCERSEAVRRLSKPEDPKGTGWLTAERDDFMNSKNTAAINHPGAARHPSPGGELKEPSSKREGNSLRSLLSGQPADNELWIALAWCVGVTAIAYLFAMRAYRRRMANRS